VAHKILQNNEEWHEEYARPLMEAVRKTSSLTDRNPKDFILFTKEHFVKEVTIKDNTGAKTYDEEAPFPTLDFPSDHGVVASALRVLMQT